MDNDPEPTEIYKQPIFWLAMAVGLAAGFPLGFYFAFQIAA